MCVRQFLGVSFKAPKRPTSTNRGLVRWACTTVCREEGCWGVILALCALMRVSKKE